MALGGDLRDALLQALWGGGRKPHKRGHALQLPHTLGCPGSASGAGTEPLQRWEPSPGRRRSSTCSRDHQTRGTAGRRAASAGRAHGDRRPGRGRAAGAGAEAGPGLKPGPGRPSPRVPPHLPALDLAVNGHQEDAGGAATGRHGARLAARPRAPAVAMETDGAARGTKSRSGRRFAGVPRVTKKQGNRPKTPAVPLPSFSTARSRHPHGHWAEGLGLSPTGTCLPLPISPLILKPRCVVNFIHFCFTTFP